jgi:hypothetical protein
MKLAIVYLGRRCAANWLRAAAKLGHQWLHGRFRVVQQHQAQGADDLTVRVAQGQTTDQEGTRLVAQKVHEDRPTAVDDLRHQGVGDHLLDTPPDKLRCIFKAQGWQEVLVALADPHDAMLAVHDKHAHGCLRKDIEHAVRGHFQQAIGIGRQGWRGG